MTFCWSCIVFIWILVNCVNAECEYDGWTDIDLECNYHDIDNLSLSTIAVQIFSNNNIYKNVSSYSIVSLLIEGINGLNITPHCITMDNSNADITIDLVREWILNKKPWPKYHEIGNLISFNNNNNISEYITFSNPCIVNQNKSNKHGIILVFNKYFSSWNIQLNSYTNNNNNYNVNTIYDTVNDNVNCLNSSISSSSSSLPIKSKINWNFELLPTNTKYIEIDQVVTKYIYVPFHNKNESTSTIIYILLIIIFFNILGGFIVHLTCNHNKKKLEKQVEELKSIQNDSNNNLPLPLPSTLKIHLPLTLKIIASESEALETPSPNHAYQAQTHGGISNYKDVITLDTPKYHHSKQNTKQLRLNMNVINDVAPTPDIKSTHSPISIVDIHNDENNAEYSLPSLPSIPYGKMMKKQMSCSVNTNISHHLAPPNNNDNSPNNDKLSSIGDVETEQTVMSELDDSILNEDYHNNLDNILNDIHGLNINVNDNKNNDQDNAEKNSLLNFLQIQDHQ